MKLHKIALALALVGGLATSAKATPGELLDFSFTINGTYQNGSIDEGPGTVSGEIYGLKLGGYTSASDIRVTENPGAGGTGELSYEGYTGLGTFDVQLVGSTPEIVATGSDGVVWSLTSSSFGGEINTTSVFEFNNSGANGSSDTGTAFSNAVVSTVLNSGGFSGATYTYTSGYVPLTPGSPGSLVPEPSQYGLFVVLAVAGVLGLRRFSAKRA